MTPRVRPGGGLSPQLSRSLLSSLDMRVRNRKNGKTLTVGAKSPAAFHQMVLAPFLSRCGGFFRRGMAGAAPSFRQLAAFACAWQAIEILKVGVLPPRATTVLCVGEGYTPKMATFIALNTPWHCVSVDPELRGPRFKRVTMMPYPIEQVEVYGKTVLIVSVFSHAKLEDAVSACVQAKKVSIVSIPCCMKSHIPGREPDIKIRHPHILGRPIMKTRRRGKCIVPSPSQIKTEPFVVDVWTNAKEKMSRCD